METAKRRFTDFFDLLEVDRNASKEAIQKAFMLKASIWHPDKAETDTDREYYTKVYSDLQAAYKILSNDRSRKQYIDAQQTTDLEFKFADRDVGYAQTDQFRTENGQFDKGAFEQAFEQTRDQRELEAFQALSAQYGQYRQPVNDDDLRSLMARRDADLENIKNETEQVFTGTGKNFDADTFNRAFDFMKERSPGKGVQPYEGDPMAMFSGGGLQECDPMSEINFRNGTDFTGQHMDNLVRGQSINPGRDLDLKSLRTGEKYGLEQKLTNDELQSRMAAIQSDREKLATLDKQQFVVEPTEIEMLYSDLFQPANIEGLEAPVAGAKTEQRAAGSGSGSASGINRIRKKIDEKKTVQKKQVLSTQ